MRPQINVRLSSGEVEKITANAELLGISKSAYIRLLASLPISLIDKYRRTETAQSVIVFDAKTMKNLLSQVTRYGGHFNQGIKALNTLAVHRNNPLWPEDAAVLAEVAKKKLVEIEVAKVDLIERLAKIENSTIRRF